MPLQKVTEQQQQEFLGIIQKAYAKEGGTDFNTFIRKLATTLKDPNNKLIQFGQSVFLMMRKTPDTVEVHTFSTEPPPALVKAFQALAKFLKSQGMKKAVTYAENPAYYGIAKQTGLPVRVARTQKKLSGQDKPVYQFEVTF
jgi:hypothetical protein